MDDDPVTHGHAQEAVSGGRPTLPLPLPEEPRALKADTRALLEQSPAEGLRVVAAGEWIADLLWDRWRDGLQPRGIDRAAFLKILCGYQNELRLWVMGERPWEHCVAGLAGRVARRFPLSALSATDERSGADESGPRSFGSLPQRRAEMRNGQGRSWQAMLQRAGVAPDADLPTLRAKIERLGLVHDLVVANGRPAGDGVGTGSYAIVWAGGRWRDPEVPFGEARSEASPARALAEALGRFLVTDPGYPLR